MKNLTKALLAALLGLSLILAGASLASADHGAVIDFEGLAEGTIVSSVASGAGISGLSVPGSVAVFGDSPAFPGTNTAMIFDATCAGGCSGGDDDLMRPELGNILIISEDLDTSDPDDADLEGAFYQFDFSGWGPGVVTVERISILDVEDIEGGARVELYAGGLGGTLLATVPLPNVGDAGFATVEVNVSGVDFMQVTLNGSGAIDNIEIIPDEQVVTPTPTSPPPTATATSPPPTATPPGPTATPTEGPPPTATPPEPTATPTDPGQPGPTPTSPPPASTPPVLIPVTGMERPQVARPWSAEGTAFGLRAEAKRAAKQALAAGRAWVPERLVIPALQLNAWVVPVGFEEGWVDGQRVLRARAPHAYAAGWHPGSAPLGVQGNTVLSGHNNAFGEVFRGLDGLRPGDLVQVYSDEQVFTYRVRQVVIVAEAEQSIEQRLRNARWIAETADERLTLVSCWPYESNTHRVIVVAVRVQQGAEWLGWTPATIE